MTRDIGMCAVVHAKAKSHREIVDHEQENSRKKTPTQWNVERLGILNGLAMKKKIGQT